MQKIEITEHALNIRKFQPETYQRLITTTILRVLPPFLDKNKITLDVGGNTGHMAYFFSDHSKKVITFEAVTVVYNELIKVMSEKPNIEAHNLAVGNLDGVATFYIDHKRLSNSGFQNLVDGPPVDVQVIKLDSLDCEPVGFIKMDVEGTELDVLKGATGILERDRPNCMVEIYKPYTQCPIHEIFDFMFERDYTCFYYDHSVPDGLVQIADTPDGVGAVEHKHHLHDGDFLFVS